MASSTKNTVRDHAPDQRKLGRIQAKRLAALTGETADKFEDRAIVQLADELRWKVDPELFLFRRICGRVVKKDPITGVEYPVPFATVSVEDTDCNLISYFPHGLQWGWHFPYFCHREIIGTTKTDKCGNFCVWVPRFDIDWILRWRHERICFPILFRRPSIGDLIAKIGPRVVGPWPPVPGPDPGRLAELTRLSAANLEAVAGRNASQLGQRIARVQATQRAGAQNTVNESLLHARAFDGELPPPLPAEFQRALSGQKVVAAKSASAEDGVRAAVAAKVGLAANTKELEGFSALRYIGPFWRCIDFDVPEWQRIVDIPDITFRVTQDTNGDGVEETIYSEGYFDVRWDAGSIPDVTLVASSNARESHACESPIVPCGNVPAILFAGLMPLDNAAFFNGTIAAVSVPPFDPDKGYALRPNRPSNDGAMPAANDLTRPEARTPFCDTLQLYGCVNVPGAKFYRFQQSSDGGATFSAVTGLPLHLYTYPGGTPVTFNPDVDGWYEVLGNPDDYHPARMLIEWPTPPFAQTILRIETGDLAKHHISYSSDVAIQTDNTSPTITPFTRLAWKFAGDPDSTLQSLIGLPCPIIRRGATPRAIEIVFEVNAVAAHLRDAAISASGCGGGSLVPIVDPANQPSHWHTTVLDNNMSLHQRYALAADAMPGCYAFGCTANSRAINPAGLDGGNLATPPWYYDYVYKYSVASISVAIVNEN